ncbi:MAG: hypothetical protein ABUL60_11915 [Myxococcales bacterium]
MKSAKTWCLAGLMVVAGLSSASCGKDEGTDGGGGRGTVIGGSGGKTGTGGLTGRSGSGGSSANAGGAGDTPISGTKLGRACVADKDCVDPDAPGLTCVTAKDTVLADGAPPKGLCTMACTRPQQAGDVDPCVDLGGLCFPFESGSADGYCIEGCAFGMPEIGETKCHDRPEFACNPALLAPTDTACSTTDDCPSGDLCVDGACDIVLPGCLPSCRGDLDCEAGMFCDQSFLNGTCVTAKPPGKALGEPCTVPSATEPDEPDDCVGFCQADAANSTKGHCAATCGLARECAWNPTSKKFDGICFYGSILTNDNGRVGDFGFCTPTCNCTDECNDPTLACSLPDQITLPADLRGPGLCFGVDPATPEYNQCSGASGGAGGESAGGAGPGTAGDSSGGVGGAG